MKKSKVFYTAINEMKIWKKFFGVNIIISSLLFSIALLLVSLALLLPDEIYNEIRNTSLGNINISNIEETDMDYLTELPMVILSYGYDMKWEDYSDSLNKKQREILAEKLSLDTSLAFEKYRKGKNSDTLININKNLLDGEEWSEKDNQKQEIMPIWIEDTLAQKLNINVQDKLIFQNRFCEVKLYVKGIYQDVKDDLMSSYVPVSLYGTLITEEQQDMILWARCNKNLNQFIKVIKQLKEKYFIVDSYEDTMQAMMLIVYMLYVCSIILIYMSVQVVNNLNHIYYVRRTRFWKICRNLGMTENDIMKINLFLARNVIFSSLIIGTVIAYYLNHRFIAYIKELFEIAQLNCDISISSVVVLYFTCEVIFFFDKFIRKKKQVRK